MKQIGMKQIAMKLTGMYCGSLFSLAVITSSSFFSNHSLAETDSLENLDSYDLPDLEEMDVFSDADITDFSEDEDDTSQASSSNWPVYSIRYQLGVNANQLDDVNTNRLDLRLQHEKYWGSQWFSRFDGKAIFRQMNNEYLGFTEDNNETTYDSEFPIREAYFQTSRQQWTFTLGYQKIAWSEFDTVEINDVIAPKDFTEFAFTAPEDARLGQPLILAQHYGKHGQWDTLINLDPEVNQYPGGGAEGLLNLSVQGTEFSVETEEPEAFKDIEFATRWYKTQDKMDYAILAGRLYGNDPTFLSVSGDTSLGNTNNPSPPTFTAKYSPFYLFGASANYSAGQFLWKAEFAYKADIQLAGFDDTKLDVLDMGIGFDFDANGAYNATVELMNQHLMEAHSGLDRDSTQINVRWGKSFFNEDLDLTYFFSYQWQHEDVVHSFLADYQWTDEWQVGASLTLFESGSNSSPGALTEDLDQLVFVVTYTF